MRAPRLGLPLRLDGAGNLLDWPNVYNRKPGTGKLYELFCPNPLTASANLKRPASLRYENSVKLSFVPIVLALELNPGTSRLP